MVHLDKSGEIDCYFTETGATVAPGGIAPLRKRRLYRSKTTISRFVWKNPRKIPQATINKIRGLWIPISGVQKE